MEKRFRNEAVPVSHSARKALPEKWKLYFHVDLTVTRKVSEIHFLHFHASRNQNFQNFGNLDVGV